MTTSMIEYDTKRCEEIDLLIDSMNIKEVINMVICKICGKKYTSLTLHLIRTHKTTTEQYLKDFPGAELVDKEFSKKVGQSIKASWDDDRKKSQAERMSTLMNEVILKDPEHLERRREISRKTMTKNWDSQEFADKVSNSASDNLKNLWKDEDYRNRHIEIARENMIALNERMNEDPDFCSRRSKRSSAFFSRMNEENWKDEEYRKIVSERSSQVMKDTLARLWQDEEYRNKMSIHNSINLKEQGKGVFTRPHRIVSDYLNSIGICHVNEEIVEGIRVDIYIPESSLVIEVNGEFWHGYHDMDEEDMSEYQRGGYLRDLRRIKAFGDKVLFLWENKDIYEGDYKSKIKAYLDKYNVSYNESNS